MNDLVADETVFSRPRDYALIAAAATTLGDRWLCADSVAVLLGMFTPGGDVMTQ